MSDNFWGPNAIKEEDDFWGPNAIPEESPSPTPSPTPSPAPIAAKQREMPGLAQRLYEQNVVIPVRAARRFAPFPETTQEYVIDPIMSLFTGQSTEERQSSREAYDRYLRETYPQAFGAYEVASGVGSGFTKGAMLGAVEPIVEQTLTAPETLGFNVETGLNVMPSAIGGALYAPKAAAKSMKYLKAKPYERPALSAYEENPQLYEQYDVETNKQPVKQLEIEVQGNIAAKEQQRANAMSRLEPEVEQLKMENARQVQQAIDDVNKQTELGAYEGDKMISANKALQDKYKETAAKRNRILEQSGGEIDINLVRPIFQKAHKEVFSPGDRDAINNAWKELASMAKPASTSGYQNVQINQAPMVISARELDRMRQVYQGMVDYKMGAHNAPYQYKLNSIAGDLNDLLDASIPLNEPLRNQIRQETIRFKKAQELFGGEYPLKKFQSASKDPMMRRDLENLAIPEIDDILKTIDYRTKFQADVKRGIKPESSVINEYLRKQAELKGWQDTKYPISSMESPSVLERSMMETYRNPKLNAETKIRGYAEQVHPQGPEDFYSKFEKTKVLRDIEGMNQAQGSRMANIAGSTGAAIGGTIGSGLDSPGTGALLGSAAGAYLGGVADYRAGNIFRSGTRMGQSLAPYRQAVGKGAYMSANVKPSYIMSILNTNPEALGPYADRLMQANQQGEQKMAVEHYIMYQNDPQYADLVRQAMEESEKKKIDLPKSKPIGEQFGELIDNALWSDKIGLDPGETGSDGFEYGEGLPQPASIRPFAFKKLWPSKSAVGSEVKQLPPVKSHGVTRDTSRQFTPEELLNGDDFYAYRDLTVPKPFESNKYNTLRFKEGSTALSEDVFGKKIDLRNKSSNYADEPTREKPSFLSGEGAMYHNPTRTGVSGAYARSPQATKHEHIHTQIERLNEIHPEAGAAMDWYLRKKARDEYKVPIAWITDSMHGPAEFMPLVGDMLEDVRIRKRYFNFQLEKDHPYNFFMPRLRKFYNEAADQVSKMDKYDVLNIVQDYIEAGKKRMP